MGSPPRGTGSYLRGSGDTMPEQVNADFVLIHFNTSDAGYNRYKARFPGKPLYASALVGAVRPDTWRATLETAKMKVRAHGLAGIVVNPEAGWQVSREEKAAFATALKRLATEMSVGIVSTPWWPGLHHDGEYFYADSQVWGAVEIYGISANSQEAFQNWISRWNRAFNGRAGITFNAGGTIDGTVRASEATYLQYLNDMPIVPWGIAWGTTSSSYEVIRTVIAANAGLLPGRKGGVASTILGFLADQTLLIVSLIVVMLIVVAVLAWWYFR